MLFCLPLNSIYMETIATCKLATLRAVVGFLGEKEQAGWWPSTFFGRASKAFIAPIFGRTEMLAQCTAVTQGAARVHDERIGVGHVSHLFRLPEHLEQRIHTALQDPEVIGTIGEAIATKDAALEFLGGHVGRGSGTGIGPIWVGSLADLRSADGWSVVAAHYLRGVEAGVEVFPYFANRV